MGKTWFWGLLTVVVDLLMFNAAFILAYNISGVIYDWLLPASSYQSILVFANFTVVTVFMFSGRYQTGRSLFDSEEFFRLLESIILCYLIITAATFLAKAVDYSRLILTNSFIIGLLTISFGRTVLSSILLKARARGIDRQKAVILGKTEVGESILKRIRERPELGYDFLGFVDIGRDLRGTLEAKDVNTVFVALEDVDQEKLIDTITECDNVEFKIVPDLVKLISEPLSFDEFRDMPLIRVRGSSEYSLYSKYLKRPLDLTLAAAALTLLSPLLLLAAAAIKLDSKGPILFAHTRVGDGGRPFTLYKFRTMREDAEKLKNSMVKSNEVKGLFKMMDDPRVTRVGYVLRRTCIDELPQLFNVIRGDMSLVGPRPHVPEEMGLFSGWRANRFKVKPGLTGVWQVSGRHEIDADKAALMDIYYVKHMSLLLDLRILVKTIPSIIYSKGRW